MRGVMVHSITAFAAISTTFTVTTEHDMKLTTSWYAEHRTAGRQDIIWAPVTGGRAIAPGASSCCFGSSSSSCGAIALEGALPSRNAS
jgi:hypothetical protein